MRTAAITGVVLLVTSIAHGDVPRDKRGALAVPSTMPAADGVDAAVAGHGAIREARVVEDPDVGYRVELRTAGGWVRRPLAGAGGEGTSYTLEHLELTDLTGDPEAELRLVYSSYRDPCGCDDGPTFSSTYVVICAVGRNGPRCSSAIETGRDDDAVDLQSFDGELSISRGGLARVKIRSSHGLSRRERAAIARPRRLFR